MLAEESDKIVIKKVSWPVTLAHIHTILTHPFYTGKTSGNDNNYVRSVIHFPACGKFQCLPRFIPVIYPVNTETGFFGFQNQPPILPRRLVPKRNCRRLA